VERPLERKPRLLLLCDRRGWAFDTTARNLASRLEAEFEFDIRFVAEEPVIEPERYDLVHVFWWGERYHRKYVADPRKIVKEISSHRWESDDRFGRHRPEEAAERYMHDAGYLLTTSLRLYRAFRDLHPRVFRYPLGVDTDCFRPKGDRTGALRFGWAGNSGDPEKGLDEILLPACRGRFELRLAPGNLSSGEMCDFYNGLDVICVASAAEGTPLPLLEAMACGCFPVCTDVGVVPEVVENGRNGLIVERTQEAFRAALAWCREHPDRIREAGRRNADLVRADRSWESSAREYAGAIRSILREQASLDPGTPPTVRSGGGEGYDAHFGRINPAGASESAYRSACRYYREEIETLLPERRDARILEVGTGHGLLLRYLVETGYTRLTGIDVSEGLLRSVRAAFAHRVERLEVADVADFLPPRPGKFDCIVMLDVIEHMTEEKASEVLASARAALAPGGRLILRTPNMANLLGGYSLHMDLTHRRGYTEWSLRQLLERCGFPPAAIGVHVPTAFGTRKRKLYAGINGAVHRALYRWNDRVPPTWFGKNIVMRADREGR